MGSGVPLLDWGWGGPWRDALAWCDSEMSYTAALRKIKYVWVLESWTILPGCRHKNYIIYHIYKNIQHTPLKIDDATLNFLTILPFIWCLVQRQDGILKLLTASESPAAVSDAKSNVSKTSKVRGNLKNLPNLLTRKIWTKPEIRCGLYMLLLSNYIDSSDSSGFYDDQLDDCDIL